MKIRSPGIRAKLIGSFLMAIIIPVAVSVLALSIALEAVVPKQEEAYAAELKKTIQSNLLDLDNNIRLDGLYRLLQAGKSDELAAVIKKTWAYLNERGEELDIVKSDGTILLSLNAKGVALGAPAPPQMMLNDFKKDPFIFDQQSTISEAMPAGKEKFALRERVGIVPGLIYIDSERAQYTWPIIEDTDGVIYGRYAFRVPGELNAVENVSGRYTVIAVMSGVASFVILVLLFSFRLSRGILVPLKRFGQAAEDIAAGNLDNPIRYERTDEFGKVAATLDDMRIRLRESLGRLQRADAERKQMVASASHDLRTPLSSIRGYVEGLRDGLADKAETRERYFSVILDKTEQLERLIDGLFRISRLELDDTAIRVENLSARALFSKIFERIRRDLESAGFAFLIETDIPDLTIRADANAVDQVVDNIVQNSKRYLAPGGRIRCLLEGRSHELVVVIADNGPGFAPRDIPRVFDPFYRGDPARSIRHGEAGLGLAICKRLVEAHGGRISAENDGGAVIRFSLPASS